MNKDSVEIQNKEESQQSQKLKQPKRYSLYDQININEKYLDYFIIGTILLLFVVVIYSIL